MNIEYELVKRLFRKQTIDKYLKKNTYLHNKDNNSVYSFLILRLFISIIIFFLTFIFLDRNLLISIIITTSFIILYTYFKYDYKIKIREKKLEKEASFFFEVLVLSLKSGKNLNQALEITIKSIDNTFSNEFKEVLDEVNYGKSTIEVINDFKDKISSENIKNILIGITEAYTLGKDMVETIEKELVLLDNKRITDIKKYINRLPITVSVVSVFILIPLMLLLILSPVILEYFG